MESWLTGLNPGVRSWVGCYFNATREDSYAIQSELGVKIAGEQKLGPFPHWTLSTRTPDKLYDFVSIPVSDWFVGGLVAQSLEPWHPPGVHNGQTMREAVDFYYNLGGLINLYSHTLSTGLGGAGQLTPDYITYSLNTNLHPRVWSANALGVYQWWTNRSQARVTADYVINAGQTTATLGISGATDPNTAVEVLVPASGSAFGLKVFTNNILASGDAYRVNGQLIRVRVGTAINNVKIVYVLGPRAQDDYYTTTAGSTLNVTAPGVMANDSAGLGSSLTVVLASAPTMAPSC